MTLELLLAVVVAGVAGVVALTAALGGLEKARLDRESARARYLQDYPEDSIQTVQLADDGRAALLAVGGAVGVVGVLGVHAFTRRLVPGVAQVLEDEGGLTLRLSDPGAPRLRVALLDPGERSVWRTRLGAA